MSHSFWSPSKSHMWMHCHGAMAQPENQCPGGSSDFADNGTASHALASWALENDKDAVDYPDLTIRVGQKEWDIDFERCEYVQTYIDEVRRRSMGGILFIEHRVDLGDFLGNGPCWKCECHPDFQPTCDACKGTGEAPQGGTSDAVIILPEEETLISMDLKYGVREKVWAAHFFTDCPQCDSTGVGNGDKMGGICNECDGTKRSKKRKINTQCGNYLLGAWKEAKKLGHKITKFVAVIDQPRLGHRDEFEITADELRAFGEEVKVALARGQEAITLGAEDPKLDGFLKPDNKTCRWCNAKARCKALTRYVAAQTKMEFSDESGAPTAIQEPQTAEHLSQAYLALPLINQWLKAVNKALWQMVPMGAVIGPDGQPLKIVHGKEGRRMWDPEQTEKIEGLMVGAVGPAAYEPQVIVTAPAFEKVLKKRVGLKGRKFEEHWEKHWGEYIKRAKGSLQIALGSDPRPTTGKADASEFNDEISTEDES